MFERGKIRMLGFKERITKIVSKKHNFDPRKKERQKSFEDAVIRITKIKADGNIKNIVEQKKYPWVIICSKFRSK